jgi:hypothetical protein
LCLPADVDHSTAFVKLLKKLRPAYDWVPAAAAPAAAAAAAVSTAAQTSMQQQQQDEQAQQQGHWQARSLSDATLKELKLTRPDKEVSSRTLSSCLDASNAVLTACEVVDQQGMVGKSVANMQQLLIRVGLLVAVMCAVLR